MGALQTAAEVRVRILDTSEVTGLGGYRLNSRHCELKWIRGLIHVKGTPAGSEQIRLAVYSAKALGARLFASDWVAVSDLEAGGAYWIGLVRFDFNRQHLHKEVRYWLAAETQNYTRTSSFHLAFQSDWNLQKHQPTTEGMARTWADLDFFGYQEFE